MSELHKEYYFPTPIYFRDVPDAEARNAQLKADIYAWRAEDGEGITRSNVPETNAWHSAIDMHHRPEFASFTLMLLEIVEQVYNDLDYASTHEPICDTMWANINPPGGLNRHHTHPGVLWSGVYYVQAPPDAGRIYFHDPRVQALVLNPAYDPGAPRRAESWSEVHFEPIEGRILLFPAWLGHDVRPNMTTSTGPAGDRISVSFNFFQAPRPAVPVAPAKGHDSRGGLALSDLRSKAK